MDRLTDRLAEAKRRLSDAAAACLENRPGAAEQADAANAEVQALLAIQKARCCRFPGCFTLTVHDYCALHRPQGEWQIADDFKREQEREKQK